MTVEILLLVATALLALVAVVAAIVAIRSVRALKRSVEVSPGRKTPHPSETGGPNAEVSAFVAVPNAEVWVPAGREVEPPTALAPRVVEGRVIVPPTQAQVVRTALGRPGVRLSVFAHGLARALRAENRDRIVSLMRREYRHRRRERLRAGRQAVRVARPTSAPSTERLHAEFAEPRPLSLTERMIGS
jgi:hypothetical protein